MERLCKRKHVELSCKYSAKVSHSIRLLTTRRLRELWWVPVSPRGTSEEKVGAQTVWLNISVSSGRSLIWYATCVDGSSNNVSDWAVTAASAVKVAEKAKLHNYRVSTEQHHFEPSACETTCVLGPSSLETVMELGDKRETRLA